MPAELHVPFKQARHYYPGRISRILWIVVHDGEVLERATSAEGIQNLFAGDNAPQASAHLSADVDSLVRSVHDWDTAWAAPGVNSNGLHVEQAGKASQQRRDWLDPYSKKMIEEQTAKAVGYWSVTHRIPLLKRGPVDINNNRSGVIGHRDATAAFQTPGGHSDPGPDYPWDVLLGAAREHAHDFSAPTVVHNPYPVPRYDSTHRPFSRGATGDKVRFVQWALGINVDGSFGDITYAAVRAFQRKHNLTIDGIVGPQTAAALAVITHVR